MINRIKSKEQEKAIGFRLKFNSISTNQKDSFDDQ
jgi:hypothetical protein